MDIVRRDYPELPQPAGAFHNSVRWDKLLFIAGSTARGTPAETGDIAADALRKKVAENSSPNTQGTTG